MGKDPRIPKAKEAVAWRVGGTMVPKDKTWLGGESISGGWSWESAAQGNTGHGQQKQASWRGPSQRMWDPHGRKQRSKGPSKPCRAPTVWQDNGAGLHPISFWAWEGGVGLGNSRWF